MPVIVPVQPPSKVDPLPFPSMADHQLGTYNSKAYAWAERHPYVADAMSGQADATYENAQLVLSAIAGLNIDAANLTAAIDHVNTKASEVDTKAAQVATNTSTASQAATDAAASAAAAANSAATVSLGPITTRVEALEAAVGGTSGALMPKSGGTFTGAVNFVGSQYHKFGPTVGVGGGWADGAFNIKALGTPNVYLTFLNGAGVGAGRIRINESGKGDGWFEFTSYDSTKWGSVAAGRVVISGGSGNTGALDVAGFTKLSGGENSFLGLTAIGNSGFGNAAYASYGPGLVINTSTKLGGVHGDHTGVLLGTTMNGWGTATLNAYTSNGGNTFDIGSPIFQFGKPGSTFTSSSLVMYTNLYVTGNIIGYYTSDKKFKKHIKPIESALDKAMVIGGKTFQWKNTWMRKQNNRDGMLRQADVGVIAQDVFKVLPEATYIRKDGSLAVAYPKLVALALQGLVEVVLELRGIKRRLSLLEKK